MRRINTIALCEFVCSCGKPMSHEGAKPVDHQTDKHSADVVGVAPAPELVTIDGWDLYKAYLNDPIRAKHAYTNKRLRVNVIVNRVYTSPINDKIRVNCGVILVTPNAKGEAEFIGIKTDQHITVEGICSGGWVADQASDFVSIDDARRIR